jgi:signal transduction histidine kinase
MARRSLRERARVAALYEHERQAAEALRAMDDIKNTFLAAVSHELRTPLTSILGFAMTLQDRIGQDGHDQTAREMLDTMVGEASRLDALLDDLLDLDRLTRGRGGLNSRENDVGALVAAVARSVAAREQRDIAVEATSLVLDCDERKVERIVENLLGNAVKYAPGQTAILVRVDPHEGGVLIAVEDEGPGVPEPLRASIFEPFRRGTRHIGHSPGTGIGLSLVQSFAELHGGRAWVEPRPGGGSSFRVFLPGDLESPPPADTHPASRPA